MKVFAQSVATKWEEYSDMTHDQVDDYFEANRAANEAAVRDLGYIGEHTGKLIREGVADGYATYMVMDTGRGGRNLSLMHMDWSDGYQFRWASSWTKKDVLSMIERAEARKRFFAR